MTPPTSRATTNRPSRMKPTAAPVLAPEPGAGLRYVVMGTTRGPGWKRGPGWTRGAGASRPRWAQASPVRTQVTTMAAQKRAALISSLLAGHPGRGSEALGGTGRAQVFQNTSFVTTRAQRG